MSLKLSFASAERCNRSKDNQFTILNGHAGTRIEVTEAISGQVIDHERFHRFRRVLVHLCDRIAENSNLNFNAFGQTILIVDDGLRG